MYDTENKDEKYFYKEYFNLAFVLRGEVASLEEIKMYIINNFANKKLVKLIKPTYEKEKLLIVDEPEWQKVQKFTIKKERKLSNEHFYFAFIVRGEVFHLEKIKEYINQCNVDVITSVYAKERVYIVEESRWNQYKMAES